MIFKQLITVFCEAEVALCNERREPSASEASRRWVEAIGKWRGRLEANISGKMNGKPGKSVFFAAFGRANFGKPVAKNNDICYNMMTSM